MAGAFLQITADDASVQAMFDRIAGFGGAAKRETFVDIGEALKNSTQDRARRQVDPSGEPWLELSPRYKAYKEKKRPGVPILRFDHHMIGDMFSYAAGDDFVDVGTNAIYGAIHQFGGTVTLPSGKKIRIPARPYLGVSEQDESDLAKIVAKHVQALIDG